MAHANPSARKVHHDRPDGFGRDHDAVPSPDGCAREPWLHWDRYDHRRAEDHDHDASSPLDGCAREFCPPWGRHGFDRRGADDQDGGRDHRAAGHQDAPDGVVAMLGGGAAAVGDASMASGFVENVAEDRGFYSIVRGEADFQAWAYSEQPGGAYADAEVFLDIGGADFVFWREVEDSACSLNEAWARAELDYVSIDIHGWSPRQGPIAIELYPAVFDAAPLGFEAPLGSLAEVLATAEAHGADTLSATFTHALAVENQFSFVSAMALVAL
jgi:hypothetical protein